jgi:hypothetical protein
VRGKREERGKVREDGVDRGGEDGKSGWDIERAERSISQHAHHNTTYSWAACYLNFMPTGVVLFSLVFSPTYNHTKPQVSRTTHLQVCWARVGRTSQSSP